MNAELLTVSSHWSKKTHFLLAHPDRLWSLYSRLSNGYRGLFPLIKEIGAWSWPSPESGAEVNAWSYIFTPSYVFMV